MTHNQTTFQPKDDLRKQLRYHKAMHLLYKEAWKRQTKELAEIAAELEALKKMATEFLADARAAMDGEKDNAESEVSE
jgi:hypothetical protein